MTLRGLDSILETNRVPSSLVDCGDEGLGANLHQRREMGWSKVSSLKGVYELARFFWVTALYASQTQLFSFLLPGAQVLPMWQSCIDMFVKRSPCYIIQGSRQSWIMGFRVLHIVCLNLILMKMCILNKFYWTIIVWLWSHSVKLYFHVNTNESYSINLKHNFQHLNLSYRINLSSRISINVIFLSDHATNKYFI